MYSTATTHRLVGALPPSEVLRDVAVAAVTAAGSMALLHTGIGPSAASSRELDLLGAGLVACSTVPLAAWRRSPLGVFAVTTAAGVLLAGLGYPVDLLLGPAVALYLLVASQDQEIPWVSRISVTTAGLFVAFAAAVTTSEGTFRGLAILHTALAWAVAWFAGERARLRREHIAELSERADRVEREAESERLLAVAEERARIARDLHDSTGQAINVIVVRAGGARLHHDTDRWRLALEVIEDLARQTAEEVDEIVGTLRDRGGPTPRNLDAPHGLSSLDTLIAHHRAAGLHVTLDTSGAPRPLNAAANQASHRLLQEALTNAARHGTGSAGIELVYGDGAIEITVTNPAPADGGTRSGGGHGLIGMRERATLLGGSLHTQSVGGAFRVHARIPYAGHTA